MAEVREQRQRERAEARAGRRTDSDRPDDSLDVRRAVTTALSAAAAGALAGAAKAAVDRRGRHAKHEPEEPQASHEPEEDAAVEDEPEQDEPEADPAQDEADQEEPEQDEPEQSGVSTGDVASMITKAKQHVEAVLGSAAESVSGIERSNGNWCVNVEVVQMRRIPESTDILASYAVLLDGDGGLISVQERRRYRRSQADDDR